MGVLNPKQARFVSTVAKLTGLNPGVVAAWALAEESGSAAAQRAASGNMNWLNYSAGTGPGGRFDHPEWNNNPDKAAAAIAKEIKTSSYYKGIAASAGKTPAEQLAAISASPWDVAHYKVSGGLTGTYKEVSGVKLPSGATAQNQPLTPVPASAPVSAPNGSSAPIGTTTPDDAQLTIQSLLQSAKQHLGVPTPGNPLLDQLMQGAAPVQQVTGLTLPSGKPAKTKLTAVTPTVSTTAPANTKGGYTVGNFDGTKVAAWMVPALQYARANGWTGKLTSGLRSTALQAQLYAKYQAGGNIAAKPGQSNHEIQNGGAFDATDPQQLWQILQGYKGKRPIYAPSVGLKDSVHFSINGH